MSISVVLADDHVVVRRGLRAVLEAEPDLEIVGETDNGVEALAMVDALRPRVLVLDVLMPTLGGFQVLKALGEKAIPTRVVVLSMYATVAYVSEALRLGATAYVVKDATADDLLRAVRHAASGQRYLSAPLSDAIIDAYTQRVRASSQDPYDTLTPREREVLILAAQGCTSGEIGACLSISPRTVESHRGSLMQKLGLRHQTDLVRYAFRRGLLDL